MIWEKEQLPNQWKEGIICPMYKKGDRLDCTNYRPIILLNVAYKIFAIILNQRLVDIIETELGDNSLDSDLTDPQLTIFCDKTNYRKML